MVSLACEENPWHRCLTWQGGCEAIEHGLTHAHPGCRVRAQGEWVSSPLGSDDLLRQGYGDVPGELANQGAQGLSDLKQDTWLYRPESHSLF